MSSPNEHEPEIKLTEDNSTESMTSDLRVDDLQSVNKAKEHVAASSSLPRVFVKPTITNPNPVIPDGLTAAQTKQLSEMIAAQTRAAVKEAVYDGALPAQVILKSQAPITDFSKMTIDDVYDLSVPIEAKAFMSADVLAINLKDTNYEARWVNKNPQRLGEMIGKGFTYIEPKDLVAVEGIQTGVDAEGHFCFNDVVAMKIDKATYYKALRAAHERAVSTTNETQMRQRAAKTANGYMSQAGTYKDAEGREVPYNPNDFAVSRNSGKMRFYDPDNAGIAI